ncbi:MAG: hypothetical protein UHD09_03025 [Bifidobacterium sp.]|nr:hypothetical protein [Bifidobacterium sp.]
MSKQKRAMYRRRRLAVLAGVLVVVAVCVFCVYSLIRGAVGMGDWIGAGERMSMSRSAAPAPKQESKVRDCSANDVELTLTPSTTAIGVGGSVEFTATIEYTGKDPEGCFVDGADDSRVLVVKSGDDTVYRSDACEDTYRPLLMMSGVKDEQKMTWNADRSGKECVADAQLPHVTSRHVTRHVTL